MDEIREYRVWNETGDYCGGAKVIKVKDGYEVHLDPFNHADDDRKLTFLYENDAFDSAHRFAETYMAEAIADFTEKHGEAPTGVMSDTGYSIQVCEGDNDVTSSI
ncbi:hypothetical protein AB0G15_05840 [Streptosporangium sp. NPDC023825]|uniref:hypothetical protein n=1 Tax=Streptosporangium sp. NPDC023825 TaxID=3154909 RepID=UPI0034157072